MNIFFRIRMTGALGNVIFNNAKGEQFDAGPIRPGQKKIYTAEGTWVDYITEEPEEEESSEPEEESEEESEISEEESSETEPEASETSEEETGDPEDTENDPVSETSEDDDEVSTVETAETSQTTSNDTDEVIYTTDSGTAVTEVTQDAPYTGDNSGAALAAIISILSAVGAAVLIKKYRKSLKK